MQYVYILRILIQIVFDRSCLPIHFVARRQCLKNGDFERVISPLKQLT